MERERDEGFAVAPAVLQVSNNVLLGPKIMAINALQEVASWKQVQEQNATQVFYFKCDRTLDNYGTSFDCRWASCHALWEASCVTPGTAPASEAVRLQRLRRPTT